ncbi:hypothetical protein TRFO_39337 [Tritrichomonas foetus]|uniref:Tubby C-terminal domain-containing protein n=1 Tax=Tritrichomonas foetus TaxID=1144522 RepID=A0A1J4J8F6_9EUKA|nr:hypothetical protein TRFO_39337 [Tritrichomonas foetus]|eukprot:OHS94519.1 hypothetical protein TRFO_39337 [Tritrichomonas foetus]
MNSKILIQYKIKMSLFTITFEDEVNSSTSSTDDIVPKRPSKPPGKFCRPIPPKPNSPGVAGRPGFKRQIPRQTSSNPNSTSQKEQVSSQKNNSNEDRKSLNSSNNSVHNRSHGASPERHHPPVHTVVHPPIVVEVKEKPPKLSIEKEESEYEYSSEYYVYEEEEEVKEIQPKKTIDHHRRRPLIRSQIHSPTSPHNSPYNSPHNTHQIPQQNSRHSQATLQENISDTHSHLQHVDAPNNENNRNRENNQKIETIDQKLAQNKENSNTSISQVLVPIEDREMITYRLVRSKSVSIRGSRIHFQLYQGGVPLLHSKIKSRKNRDVVYISEGTEIHFGQQNYAGAVLYANNGSSFSLRSKNEYGDELMTIRYHIEVNGCPRRMTLFFPNKFKDYPEHLHNRKAYMNASGQWVLDMHGKFTMKSIKNCVIIDENDNEYAFVTKVEKETLGIEALEDFSPMMVFALGFSAFICKI